MSGVRKSWSVYGWLPYFVVLHVVCGLTAPALAFTPDLRILSLQEKAELPHIFVAEVESWGASSAKEHAPELDLYHLGETRRVVYAVLRIEEVLKESPEEINPRRVLVRVYSQWFYEWVLPVDRPPLNLEGVPESLFRKHYLGRRLIFFGYRLDRLIGVPDERTLKMLGTSPAAMHELPTRLPELRELLATKTESPARK